MQWSPHLLNLLEKRELVWIIWKFNKFGVQRHTLFDSLIKRGHFWLKLSGPLRSQLARVLEIKIPLQFYQHEITSCFLIYPGNHPSLQHRKGLQYFVHQSEVIILWHPAAGLRVGENFLPPFFPWILASLLSQWWFPVWPPVCWT